MEGTHVERSEDYQPRRAEQPNSTLLLTPPHLRACNVGAGCVTAVGSLSLPRLSGMVIAEAARSLAVFSEMLEIQRADLPAL